MKICGIYCIMQKSSMKIYIGSSNDVKSRIHNHRYQLTNNCHDNKRLQNSWNKYGDCDFEFFIIATATPRTQFLIEQYFLDLLKPSFNIYHRAIRPPIFDVNNQSRIDKMRKIMLDMWKDPEYRKKVINGVSGKRGRYDTVNKVLTDDHRKKLRLRALQRWQHRRAIGLTCRIGSEKGGVV